MFVIVLDDFWTLVRNGDMWEHPQPIFERIAACIYSG
jgi:hypothetical protein